MEVVGCEGGIFDVEGWRGAVAVVVVVVVVVLGLGGMVALRGEMCVWIGTGGGKEGFVRLDGEMMGCLGTW